MKVIGIIPARFGSTRFPGKPLAPLLDKTLIQHTYENACRSTLLDTVVVATDSTEILDHVISFGGKAVLTSETAPTGTDRLAEVILNNPQYDADIIVNIQGDEPTIETAVIDSIIEALKKNPKAVVSTAATALKQEEALDPSKVKCVLNIHGEALYFSRALIPAGPTLVWQTGGNYLKHLGIYAYRKSFLLAYPTLSMQPLQKWEDLEQLKILEHGYTIQVTIVASGSLGIDTPEDLHQLQASLSCKQNMCS